MEKPNFIYELITYDGEVIDVMPSQVDAVTKAWAKGSIIAINGRSLSSSDIRRFEPSDRVQQKVEAGIVPLLKASESVPSGPQPAIKNDSVVVEWVKKYVPVKKWESYYSANTAYRKLAVDGGNVVMAFRRPIFKHEPLPDDLFPTDIVESTSLEKWRTAR